MEDKDVMKICGELHDFLEDKEIYYPKSIFVLEVYKAWVLKCVTETALSK